MKLTGGSLGHILGLYRTEKDKGNCHLEYLGFGAYHEWFGEAWREASPAVVRIRSPRTYSLLPVLNDLIPHVMGTFTKEATLG